MSRALLLGLDVGTTAVKAAVFDESGAEVADGRAVTPWRTVPTGAELDPNELLDAVLEATAAEIAVVIDAAARATPPGDPLARIDAVVQAVFRLAVRRPALLGLVGELSRLPPAQAERLRSLVDPLIERAVAFLGEEMAGGRLRPGDPRLVAALAYGTISGIATEPEVLRGVGWTPSPAGLRRLRAELRAFLRAALAPESSRGKGEVG